MLCEYSHTKSGSLAQIHTIMAEIQHFFLGDCFLLVHPVYVKNRTHITVTRYYNKSWNIVIQREDV